MEFECLCVPFSQYPNPLIAPVSGNPFQQPGTYKSTLDHMGSAELREREKHEKEKERMRHREEKVRQREKVRHIIREQTRARERE